MTADVLLVFGPRALADNPAAVAWARERIAAKIAMLPHGATVLTGGCVDSPDEWASEYVMSSRVDLVLTEFRLDGHIWVRREQTPREWLQYAPPGSEAKRGTPKWPLCRNEAMERALAHARTHRRAVAFLGFTAAWSKTHGSDHMLGRLDDYPGTAHPAPLEYAPHDDAAAVRARVGRMLRQRTQQ